MSKVHSKILKMSFFFCFAWNFYIWESIFNLFAKMEMMERARGTNKDKPNGICTTSTINFYLLSSSKGICSGGCRNCSWSISWGVGPLPPLPALRISKTNVFDTAIFLMRSLEHVQSSINLAIMAMYVAHQNG